MDDRARDALRSLVRAEVSKDLDKLAGELARVRQELLTLERMVGLPGAPLAVRERRARVAELRASGYSQRAIAAALHVSRDVVTKDLKVEGVPTPQTVTGLDGRAVRGPRVRRSP
jgi:DNA-binding NarL/FixJ family response regulator